MSQFGLGLSLAFIWVAFSLPTSISNSCDDGEAFHFGHIFVGADGSGVPQVEKAVQLAVEKINATMPLLSYKFNYTARATKVRRIPCDIYRHNATSKQVALIRRAVDVYKYRKQGAPLNNSIHETQI